MDDYHTRLEENEHIKRDNATKIEEHKARKL